MKKTLSLIIIAGSLLANSAYAKTEGNYVGIDILRSSTEHKYAGISVKDKSAGFGANYKYAFNFDKIFLAPGVFAERLGSKVTDDLNETTTTNYRYGAKLDLGYDVTDNFAAYFTNGFANVRYKLDDHDGYVESKSAVSYFYGAGLSYKILKNLTMNLEYNTQSPSFTNVNGVKIKSDIKVTKIGVSYNF